MNNFPEFNHEGLGGVQTFNFIPTHDVDEIPYSWNHIQAQAVALKTGKQWFTGRAVPRTLQLSEKMNRNDLYEYKLSGIITGKDQNIIPLFQAMAAKQFIVDTTDQNGSRRLLGTNDYGMDFSWSHNTGESTSDRNQFSFEFKITLVHPANTYNPA